MRYPRVWIVALIFAVSLCAQGCGVILGDQDPGLLTRLAVTLVVGVALGYGFFRWQQHGWRGHRRDRRDERQDRRDDRRNPPTPTPS